MTPWYQVTAPVLRTFVKQLQLPWSKPQQRNFILLGTAFLAARSLPLRRLARAISGPTKAHRHTDKKLRRFLGNVKLSREGALQALLQFVLPRFTAQPFIPVMLDWMHVGTQKAILVLHIPYRGRSLPLWAAVHPWAGNDEMHEHEQAALRALRRAWPKAAPPPLLLADRGFAKSTFLRWLHDNQWLYVIRVRRRTTLRDAQGAHLDPEADVAVGQVRLYADVTYHAAEQIPGHLAVTCALDKQGNPSYWRLLSNLPVTHLRFLPRLYAQRMSPEETHRDYKRGHFVGGFALAHLERMQNLRLENLLCCLNLLYALLVLVAETDRESREWLKRRHWGLSLVTFGLAVFVAAGKDVHRAVRQALASVRFEPLWLESGDS
ncbi:MAG: transposase [Actinomycetota bacterium]